jgi:hypothetical protein
MTFYEYELICIFLIGVILAWALIREECEK